MYSFILIKGKIFCSRKKAGLVDFFEIQTNNHRFIILIYSHIWTQCVDFWHIHCIVHLHIETKERGSGGGGERTTVDVVRTYKLPSCFLFSCLLYLSLFVSFSFTTPSVCMRKSVTIHITMHCFQLFSLFAYWREERGYERTLVIYFDSIHIIQFSCFITKVDM